MASTPSPEFPLKAARFASEDIEVDVPLSPRSPSPSAAGASASYQPAIRPTRSQRKRLNRSSDEEPLPNLEENLHYEHFATYRLARLVAPAPTKFRLPLMTFPADPEDYASLEVGWEFIKTNIISILSSLKIDFHVIRLAHRRPTTQPTSLKELTIFFCAGPYYSSNWKTALDRIRRWLKDQQKLIVSSLRVEMVTDATEGHWSYLPMPMNDPLVERWNSQLRADVRHYVNPMSWWHIDLVNMSYIYPSGETSPTKPTVCVITEVAEWDRGWTMVATLIGDHFKAFGHPDIMFQVRHGNFERYMYSPGAPSYDKSNELDVKHYEAQFSFLGLSIGSPFPEKAQSTGGTAGVELILTLDNRDIRCVLTCYHVVMPHGWPEGLKEAAEDANKNGFNTKHELSGKIIIRCPGQLHHERNLEYLTKCAEHFQRVGFRDLAEKYKKKISNRKNLVSEAERFGVVVAGSGQQKSILSKSGKVDRRADWALIELDHSRVLHAGPSSTQNELPKTHEIRDADGVVKAIYQPRNLYLDGIVDMRIVDEETGLGSSFGHMVGAVSGCTISRPTDVLPITQLPDDPEGFEADEWLFLRKDRHDPPFSLEGDSGGVVFDSSGRWIGMVFGGNKDCNRSYVTPAGRIIADIEHVTGGRVRLPQMKPGTYLQGDRAP